MRVWTPPTNPAAASKADTRRGQGVECAGLIDVLSPVNVPPVLTCCQSPDVSRIK
jgi:hypothetical protein